MSRGLTLASIAAGTGISTSFLSLLEQGRTDISLGRLLPLLEFYELSASEILDTAHTDRDLVRNGDAPLLFTMADGIDVYLAAPSRNRTFLPLIVEYSAGTRMQHWSEHDGEEFLFVLEGNLEIEIRGSSSIILQSGDSYFFRSAHAHRVSAAGHEAARGLVITTGEVPV